MQQKWSHILPLLILLYLVILNSLASSIKLIKSPQPTTMGLLHYLRVYYWYLSTYLYVRTDAERSCICPGDVVTYECTIISMPYGGTIFRGNPSSFYDCIGDSNDPTEIVLHHSQFNDSIQSTCNNRTVVGQSLSNDDNTYYKLQLNITVTSELIGDTIKCVHDNGTHNDIVIGQSKINNTALSSPIRLHLNKVDFQSNQLTFDWNPVAPDCQAVEYHIRASNCGSCPITTNNTSVTCTDVTSDGLCIFFVETVVCGSIITNQNDTLNITLNRSVLSEIGCIGLAASTGALAILLSLCIGVFSTVTIFMLKQRKEVKPFPPATSEGVMTAGRTRSQSPMYDEMVSVIHPSSSVTIDTEQNIAYSSAIKH